MKFISFAFFLLICSCMTPWVSYSIKYVGSVKEKDLLVKELESKKQEYRVITHDSGMIYEVQYRSK